MAQTSTLVSASITNADASPIVKNTMGMGAQGELICVTDYITALSGDDVGSTYRLVRFPTTAKVKLLLISATVTTAGAIDVDVAYSNSTNDGTQAVLAAKGIVGIPTNPNQLFGAATDISAFAKARTDFTHLGVYTPAMANIQMWQNLVTLGTTDFTADPGGFFDIYAVVTTGIDTGGYIAAEIYYTL